jgi:L-threonylcarbamoyladenylate synthase
VTVPILPATEPANIAAVARLLCQGGVGVVPTDTVYGLAASIMRPEAILRVFAIKEREPAARVPILLASGADLPLLVHSVPRQAWALIDAFWPGPLTLVLPARPSVPKSITAGLSTVGVRVPSSISCLQLLSLAGEPLVGTSANIAGRAPALGAAEAASQLGERVDFILEDDAGITAGMASTVVEVAETSWAVHREGAISIDAIAAILGPSQQRR